MEVPREFSEQEYGSLAPKVGIEFLEISIGTAVAVGADKRVMGMELNVNHIRSIRKGFVTATGVPLHVGEPQQCGTSRSTTTRARSSRPVA